MALLLLTQRLFPFEPFRRRHEFFHEREVFFQDLHGMPLVPHRAKLMPDCSPESFLVKGTIPERDTHVTLGDVVRVFKDQSLAVTLERIGHRARRRFLLLVLYQERLFACLMLPAETGTDPPESEGRERQRDDEEGAFHDVFKCRMIFSKVWNAGGKG